MKPMVTRALLQLRKPCLAQRSQAGGRLCVEANYDRACLIAQHYAFSKHTFSQSRLAKVVSTGAYGCVHLKQYFLRPLQHAGLHAAPREHRMRRTEIQIGITNLFYHKPRFGQEGCLYRTGRQHLRVSVFSVCFNTAGT